MDQDLSAQLHSYFHQAHFSFHRELWLNYNHTDTFMRTNKEAFLPFLCLGVLTLFRQTAWPLHSHTQFSSHQIAPQHWLQVCCLFVLWLSLFSWLLCALWKQYANFFKSMSQFYLNSSAGFILLVWFSLLEDGLIIPLIHERDLISSPRMSLQTAAGPVSCRAQPSGAFSGRF